ncbi:MULTISPECIES: hypothetical protein [Hyphomicrobiales]|uniref:Lipoprotein n=1 Tax=Agrobacterium pusense TaxID=648995 RepID=A0AA44EFP3_9HYPH|nr:MULTISPECIES: hypothetical protein [Hyphomicrobiales]KAB2697756.1 hypothetical protein F9K79_16075 [Ochrobactrum sp. Kaboul]MBO9196025.1 hypothetical protein [Rhizobium sp. 16-449-1b]MDH0616125.1 hypothetical protein [Agrobacterium sp. GD03872]MDH0698665.1 hypothetical protein [Agrobacterium sp. GD03871]MDH0873203.1 hypothetical protein [Agrobacterium pusense]
MRIIKTLFWPLAITIPLAACGQHAQSSRPLPPAPYAYLSLTACRHYPSNIVECQLDYGTQFGRHRLGPVQQVSRDLATNLDGSRYQITACWPVSRVQRELPNFTCRISHGQSGADAGSVLVKGGTAVRLARILGDRDQIEYRWKPDRWSRLHD